LRPLRGGRDGENGELHAFAIFGFAALIFFVMSFPLTRVAGRTEKRLV
jgi:ABC-type amino acid transport system permease subunit